MTGRILLEPMKLMLVSDNWLDFAPEAKAAVKGADSMPGDLKAGHPLEEMPGEMPDTY